MIGEAHLSPQLQTVLFTILRNPFIGRKQQNLAQNSVLCFEIARESAFMQFARLKACSESQLLVAWTSSVTSRRHDHHC